MDFPIEVDAKDLTPYEDYILWDLSYTTGDSREDPGQRALVRAAAADIQDDEPAVYVYVGLPWGNDSRTVPAGTKFTVVGKVER